MQPRVLAQSTILRRTVISLTADKLIAELESDEAEDQSRVKYFLTASGQNL